jgi:hypothetical protein
MDVEGTLPTLSDASPPFLPTGSFVSTASSAISAEFFLLPTPVLSLLSHMRQQKHALVFTWNILMLEKFNADIRPNVKISRK